MSRPDIALRRAAEVMDTYRYWPASADYPDQRVHVDLLGLDVGFAAGEEMRTEVSAKFRGDGMTAELAVTGFDLAHLWTDPQDRFGLSLSVVR